MSQQFPELSNHNYTEQDDNRKERHLDDVGILIIILVGAPFVGRFATGIQAKRLINSHIYIEAQRRL